MFGPEFQEIWPKAGTTLKLTDFGKNLLKQCQTLEKPDASKINIQEFIKKSSNFPVEFGTNTCRVISQPKSRYPIIEQQIASAYPVIHERVLGLYLAFLEHKCEYGHKPERNVYRNITLSGFVNRLLKNRCVAFIGSDDEYLLLSGKSGRGDFTKVGTSKEKSPLKLENVLSYDEMKLSAFLSVSSHSEFLNDGNRFNAGIIEDKSKIIPNGVVIGLIGGRFEREGVMEAQDIYITPTQNTTDNGYGVKFDAILQNCATAYRQLWQQFYEQSDFSYDSVRDMDNSQRFYKSPRTGVIFDNLIMARRYAISFDTLLLDAETRALHTGQQAYIHMVGIGLGAWRVVSHQVQIFLNTFEQRLKALLPKLTHVSIVDFSWFHLSECGGLKNNRLLQSDTHPAGGIRTFFSNRNPAEKLRPEFANMLLVMSYAWDSNALPGNEFWLKNLTSTGDPSTACSTLISELHNPHINTQMVNGNNLHIATLTDGIMHIKDYCEKVL